MRKKEIIIGNIKEWKAHDIKVYERIMEKMRDINTSFEWWDDVYMDYTMWLEKIGFSSIDILFSGFWSQGDGASFTAEWHDYNVNAEAEEIKDAPDVIQDLYNTVMEVKGLSFFTIKRNRSLYYVHSRTVYVDHVSNEEGEELENADEVENNLFRAVEHVSSTIYETLDKEYEYLTSDEIVEETLMANEYDFNEQGEFVPF